MGLAGFFDLFEQGQQLVRHLQTANWSIFCSDYSSVTVFLQHAPHDMFRINVKTPGDITQPCLTPRSIMNQSESPLVVRTANSCSFYRFATRWIMWTRNPICSIVSHSFLLLTVKCFRIISETHTGHILVSTLLNNNPHNMLTICPLVPFSSTKPVCYSAISLP